jgi:hypothetical protein
VHCYRIITDARGEDSKLSKRIRVTKCAYKISRAGRMTENNWWCGLPILIEQPAHRAPGGQSLKHFIESKSLQLLALISGAMKSRMAKPTPGATDH